MSFVESFEIHIIRTFIINAKIFLVPSVPSKWFRSAVCVQIDMYIVSQSADPNHFRGRDGIELTLSGTEKRRSEPAFAASFDLYASKDRFLHTKYSRL